MPHDFVDADGRQIEIGDVLIVGPDGIPETDGFDSYGIQPHTKLVVRDACPVGQPYPYLVVVSDDCYVWGVYNHELKRCRIL